jgi:23S rRNA (adenine2503-C2)-methyltransferase
MFMTVTAPITPDVLTIPRKLPEGKVNLVGLTRDGMRAALIAAGTPERQARMRVGQVWQWIYHWGVRDFVLMTNLSKDFRALLAETFVIALPEIVTKQVSNDGTRKYLVRIQGGHEVEVVYIPETDRGTLCISSQVGCTLTCSFCHTGTQKLVRNLTAGEIIGQVMLARDDLGEWPVQGAPKDEQRLLSNIVLMGMGEPLYNFENVRDAMKIAMDPEGISLSRRRITLSTSGVVPEIARTAVEIGCQLAVSFHATTDAVRDTLVPINNRFNVREVLAAADAYEKKTGRRYSIEYALIRDINDQSWRSDLLGRLLKSRNAHVNLIPLNPTPGSKWTASRREDEAEFVRILESYGVPVTVRDTRGREIDGACGQLAAAEKGKE